MKTLINILMKTQDDLCKDMLKELRKIYGKNTHYGISYIYCAGDIPILLVAHMDTVHACPPNRNNIFYDKEKRVLWSPVGIGGDDRCGVYGIMKLLEKGYRPHILFTKDEEVGGLGADDFCADYEQLPVKFMIELDRRGNNECVYYGCENQEFKNYIRNFKFKEDIGSFSDIDTLMSIFDVAGVNLSAGYHKEHTLAEHINLNHLDSTLKKVEEILKDEDRRYFSAEYVDDFDILGLYQKYGTNYSPLIK